MTELLEWASAHETLFWWLTVGSVVMFIATLIIIPILVARIPEDYFSSPRHRGGRMHGQHPLAYWSILILKNLVGVVFIVMGIAMLLLPGQGILSILIGISLTNFPGKYKLERKLVSLPKVLHGLNWLRSKSGHPPLLSPRQE